MKFGWPHSYSSHHNPEFIMCWDHAVNDNKKKLLLRFTCSHTHTRPFYAIVKFYFEKGKAKMTKEKLEGNQIVNKLVNHLNIDLLTFDVAWIYRNGSVCVLYVSVFIAFVLLTFVVQLRAIGSIFFFSFHFQIGRNQQFRVLRFALSAILFLAHSLVRRLCFSSSFFVSRITYFCFAIQTYRNDFDTSNQIGVFRYFLLSSFRSNPVAS